MKKLVLFFLLFTPVFSTAQNGNTISQQDDLFCTQLNKIVEAAYTNFKSIKEELIKEKVITWGEKEYYKTKIKMEGSELNSISNDSVSVFKAAYGTDISITKSMQEKYQAIKLKIKKCLGASWKFEQQNTNDILFSSSYVAKKEEHSPEVQWMFYDNGTGMIAMELRVVAAKK